MKDLMMPGADRLAKVRYFTSDYEILSPGSHVICAGTGERIPIREIKYWCHIRQEAYKDSATATRVHEERRAKAQR
ncbi:DUF2093 domain-containing protein [Govanella unica]|uniref:DUF2093 domain-containing protein n=1 Tax=Govanella unica TaxID=2975056 RepID=A0A9X3Z6Q5_9PROT|nr:DUF2093 domain-containing protein [Govania unica]MDA5193337.1 DUF2093 domain-containing protein [Govania unica]